MGVQMWTLGSRTDDGEVSHWADLSGDSLLEVMKHALDAVHKQPYHHIHCTERVVIWKDGDEFWVE